MPLPTPRTHAWHDTRHHDSSGRGFRNIWQEAPAPSFPKTMGWVFGQLFSSKPAPEPTPTVPLDPATLTAPPERLRVTWVGHAATLIQTPGAQVLTDPMFGYRASPVSFAGPARQVPVPIPIEKLPPIHLVLISHDHYDHLDKASIKALIRHHDPLFLVPLGVDQHLREWGATNVVAMDWGQSLETHGLRIHCMPARHFSGRSLRTRDHTLWASWFIEDTRRGTKVYFGGDSAYGPFYSEITKNVGAPDVALLPIGAYLPRWFMQRVHVDPAEAVQAFADLQARHLVPIHHGTFDLADELLDAPRQTLREVAGQRGLADRVHLLPVGGIFGLD